MLTAPSGRTRTRPVERAEGVRGRQQLLPLGDPVLLARLAKRGELVQLVQVDLDLDVTLLDVVDIGERGGEVLVAGRDLAAPDGPVGQQLGVFQQLTEHLTGRVLGEGQRGGVQHPGDRRAGRLHRDPVVHRFDSRRRPGPRSGRAVRDVRRAARQRRAAGGASRAGVCAGGTTSAVSWYSTTKVCHPVPRRHAAPGVAAGRRFATTAGSQVVAIVTCRGHYRTWIAIGWRGRHGD